MFYTGVSSAENGQVQRILSATSADLITWTRTSLRMEADPTYYEKWTSGLPEEHWRDPWVEWIQDLDCWLMFITARVNVGPSDGRGVIALASSADLSTWTVHPPVTTPGHFGCGRSPAHMATGLCLNSRCWALAVLDQGCVRNMSGPGLKPTAPR